MSGSAPAREGPWRRLKSAVRGRLPRRLWDAAAAGARRADEAVATGLSAVLAGGLGLLPDGVRLALYRRLELYRPLDYRGARIRLRITSPSEQRIRLRSCEKEPETVAWLEESLRPGDVLYDIGANVGAYSLVAAKAGRGEVRVYAFEPGHRTFESLVENIALNGEGGRIVPLPVALGNRTGLVEFTLATREAGAARHPGIRVDGGDAGDPSRVQILMGYTLDELVRHLGLPQPTLVKVDVDGGELGVLRGAATTLDAPGLRSVLLETTPDTLDGATAQSVLETHGFALARATPRGGGEVNCLYVRSATRRPGSAR